MKTKILVAMIACLAIGACSKHEGGKEEKKAGSEQTQGAGKTEGTQPAAPATGGHSAAETNTNLAADDTAAQTNAAANTATTTAQDADKKMQDMKQDMTNTANQVQGNSATTGDAAKTETHQD